MISREEIPNDLAPAYQKEDNDLRARSLTVACALALVGTGSGVTLDYVVYPELMGPLISTRLGAMALIAAIFWIQRTRFGPRFSVLLNVAWAIVVNLSICVMILLSEGTSSPYYSGLNLVLLGGAILMPWTLKETLAVSVATLAMYAGACVVSAFALGNPLNPGVLFNNGFFISLSGLISTTSSHFTSQSRIRNFNLRTELDSRNRELEEMDRLKSQFFANVSHELRTPLTLILGPIQDLLQKPEALSDAVSKHLRTARDNALRLLKLVNDLLEVIKLEEGKARFDVRKVDLNAFIRSTMDSMAHMAEPRGIVLEKDLPAEPLYVAADTYALERILLNLLSNAIKFTPEGGSVAARTQVVGEMARFEIVDTGIGISEEDLPRIFERFQQVDGSSTRKYQGSGLGLALVKDLAEKLGGSATADSRPGKGTIMAVTLPVFVESDLEAGAVEPAPERSDALERIHHSAEQRAAMPIGSPFGDQEARLPDGQGPSLLIADDEPDMRQYLTGFLEEEYRIAQARDGTQAEMLAREHLPDLMLLDLMLPELDGLEVCRRLKRDPETRNIKIVLLTARIDEEAKITALRHGADDFLTKPFSRSEVETRLSNLLATARLEAELIDRNERLEETLVELKQTQANLVRSEKLNALGGLSAGLLHEVNNPLNYVITALQLARRDAAVRSSANLSEYFDDIDEGVGRIRDIVSDLRTFAHPSEVDKRKEFSMNAAIESSLRFTASERAGLNVEKELDPNDDMLGSEGHIIQVLINLLSNAARAIKDLQTDRPGVIAVRTERMEDRMRVSVSDNGVGMDEKTMNRVFEPFFTTKDVNEGMGLGLSICHTIVKSFGGRIGCASVEGEGSEFHFELPLGEEDLAGDTSERIREAGVELERK